MKKFLREQKVRSMNLPVEFGDVAEVLKENFKSYYASLQVERLTYNELSSLYNFKQCQTLSSLDFKLTGNQIGLEIIPPVSEYILPEHYALALGSLLRELNPSVALHRPSQLCRRFSRLSIAGEVFGSSLCRTDRNSSIAAYWPTNSHTSTLTNSFAELELAVGFVQFFIEYKVRLSENHQFKYLFAYVKWSEQHQESHFFGSSTIVSSSSTEPHSPYSFIPVQRIANRCAHAKLNTTFDEHCDKVLITVPLNSQCWF